MKSVRDFFVRVSIYCIGSFLHLALYSAISHESGHTQKLSNKVSNLQSNQINI